MYLIAIAWVLGVPAYYLAKAKGRSGGVYAILIVALGLFTFGFGPLALLAPVAAFGVLYLLPARPGAPGKAYLKIVFACPECGKTITFPRSREGDARLCPECGEIIRVPQDKYSPKASIRGGGMPTVEEGEVCFESFGMAAPAQQLAAYLSAHGVSARVSGDDAGGALPYVGNTQGHNVLIDASQWEEAARLVQECQEE